MTEQKKDWVDRLDEMHGGAFAWFILLASIALPGLVTGLVFLLVDVLPLIPLWIPGAITGAVTVSITIWAIGEWRKTK